MGIQINWVMVGLLRRAAIEKIGAAASSIYYGLENKSFASLVAQGVVFINMAKKMGRAKGACSLLWAARGGMLESE